MSERVLAARPLDDRELAGRVRGTPLVVLLDVDGTLAPIAPRPEEAGVPGPTRDAVARLARCPGVHVALVSGRAAADALGMVAVPGLWAVGNHGAETVAPDGTVTVDPGVAAAAPALAAAARELAGELAGIGGVLVEDKRWSLSIHHRLAPPELVPQIALAVERAAHRHGLRLGRGKAVHELRAPVTIDKGTAVLALADRLGARAPDASVVFVGDDVTDEDAFRALRGHAAAVLTVRVADPGGHAAAETAADFHVAGTEAVRRMLERIADLRRC